MGCNPLSPPAAAEVVSFVAGVSFAGCQIRSMVGTLRSSPIGNSLARIGALADELCWIAHASIVAPSIIIRGTSMHLARTMSAESVRHRPRGARE